MVRTARLKDIAEVTGFSVNTVSLALRASDRIPQETRRQIEAAAERLDYQPNQVAKSLVLQRTQSIGLILTELTNPVLSAVAEAVELELSKRGYTTLFATSNSQIDLEKKMIGTLHARRADGMLIFPCNHRDLGHIRALRARNYPIVLLVGDPDAGIDAVCVDERQGACKAVTHLLALGHRRIAHFGSVGQTHNREKYDGYVLAHERAGVPVDPALMITSPGHDVRSGHVAMQTLAQSRLDATAAFTVTDSMALGAMHYCARNGIAVPREMSIVGFDNIEYGANAATTLSTIDYEFRAVARLAIERVLALIACEDVLPPPVVTQIEPALLIRESTAICRSTS